MKICIVGVGYVGLVTGACFADLGNNVWCIDNNREKVDLLEFSSGILEAVWLLFKVLSCLESSGRVVGFISAHFRPDPTEFDRVMTKNVKKLTTKKATTIYM